MEDLTKLREELELLQKELEQTEFGDEEYDILLSRIGDIQKILNADTELREKKSDNRKKRVGGVLKFVVMVVAYAGATAATLYAEESRPIITKALNMPKDILKLKDD